MVVTQEWMKEWFDRFNHDYFKQLLPSPAFSLSRGRSRLGQFSCKYMAIRGIGKPKGCKITLSTYYNMSERQAGCVLLHEMIHYYIAYLGLKDTGPHGVVFRSIANTLNREYGWEISVSTSTAGWEVTKEIKERNERQAYFIVLAVETVDKVHFLSVVTPSYVRRLDNYLKKAREVRHYAWYISRDSYFQDFPKVRSLRGKRVTREVFMEKTSASQPLSL